MICGDFNIWKQQDPECRSGPHVFCPAGHKRGACCDQALIEPTCSERRIPVGYCRNQGMVRYAQTIIAPTGINQAHHGHGNDQRSGKAAAIKLITNAPSVAVAVQPYHHISGARNSSAGSTASRERCMPGSTMSSEG